MCVFDDLFEVTTSLGGTWIPQSDVSVFPEVERADLHQQEMFETLRSQDHEAVLNTNPTGAGKTLSWAAPTIRSGEWGDGWRVLATYPTKALVEDQYHTILELFKHYYKSEEYESERDFHLEIQQENEKIITDGDEEYRLSNRVVQATSDSVDSTTAEIERAKRKAAGPSQSGIPTVVLTTPDSLTLIAAGLPFDSDEESALIEFDKIVIDEFHLANPRAKRLLPFHLNVTLSMPFLPYLEKLVFLSATPLPDYVDRLKNAFDTANVTSETHDRSDEGRHILPKADLYVSSRDMFSNGGWLADNIEEVADFYESPGQTLVVLDSVREVDEVYTALEEETELAPGRIYGWKKAGRSEAIEEADVIVGNTAVEVGIDFDNLNRVISTAYEPMSAIQRIGRMRHRGSIDDYKIALITKPAVQTGIIRRVRNRLGRQELQDILIEELGESAEIPYYDLLCAAYSQYLWYDSEEYPSDSPLREKYSRHGGKSAEERYSEIVHRHFADGASKTLREELSVTELWDSVEKLRRQYYRNGNGEYPVFKEMHTYRPSSLSCLILDESDDQEPIKSYQLRHALKYCNGYLVEDEDEFVSECRKRLDFDNSHRELIDDNSRYVCAYFVATGKDYDTSRYYRITDYSCYSTMEHRWKEPGGISEIWSPSVETDPAVRGTENVQIGEDSQEEILARYVGYSRDDAVDKYNLGPYANATQIGKNSTILFWQDGILAEAQIAHEFFEGLDES